MMSVLTLAISNPDSMISVETNTSKWHDIYYGYDVGVMLTNLEHHLKIHTINIKGHKTIKAIFS